MELTHGEPVYQTQVLQEFWGSQEFDVCCCEIIRAEIVHCQLRCRSNWRSPKKCWEGAAKLFSEDDG